MEKWVEEADVDGFNLVSTWQESYFVEAYPQTDWATGICTISVLVPRYYRPTSAGIESTGPILV
jgi:hypothetical protein